ncbi:hypothetical protein GQ282_004618 [Salmonella enterica subsp. enterica serovar Montevideo]|nr:hypothetical protein [Salmonella enterica subsp. enterica]EDU9708328.1 hypothetical protein [Salmonella enterica]EEJ0797343.1 hypothetical protein [Salmonella enterica subsp. enterica serovar Montevideo]EFI3628486.1 hypothetical protein [Escherichia coli]
MRDLILQLSKSSIYSTKPPKLRITLIARHSEYVTYREDLNDERNY